MLPLFNVLNAACAIGLMEAAVRRTVENASGVRHSDTGATLAELPTIRNYIARMRVTDAARALMDDTIAAIGANRPDTMLRVLECKAAAGETATGELDLACACAEAPRFARTWPWSDISATHAPPESWRLARQKSMSNDTALLLGGRLRSQSGHHSGRIPAPFRAPRPGLRLVLFSNYERQVEAHLAGHIHVAWNSPLAWLQSERIATALGRRAEAICMRDTPLTRAGQGFRIRSLRPARRQARRSHRRRARGRPCLGPRRSRRPLLHRLESSVVLARSDPAGRRDARHPRTPPYDHRNFTVLDGAPEPLIVRFRELLLGMSYADPDVRPLLDMEGLKRWLPGRTEGYAALDAALTRFGTVDEFVKAVVANCK